jgi:hypothetical protein
MILVTEAIIHTKKKYIIVISGLDKDIVNDICLKMSQILKYTYLSFLDNPIIDDSKNYNNIFYRVEELIKIKPQGIIISLLSYPDKYTMIDVKLHINLAINQTYFNNIKKKYDYLDDFFIKYNNILKNNKVHKYINIKLDSDLNQIKKQCFDTIITSIEQAYYGTNYEKILQYRNDDNSSDNGNSNNSNNSNKKLNNSDNKNYNNSNNYNKKLNNYDNKNNNSDNKNYNNSNNSNKKLNNYDNKNNNSDNKNYNNSNNSNKKLNNYNSKRTNKKSFRSSSEKSDSDSSEKSFRESSEKSDSNNSEKSDSDSDSSEKSFSSNSSIDQYLNFDNDSDY